MGADSAGTTTGRLTCGFGGVSVGGLGDEIIG